MSTVTLAVDFGAKYIGLALVRNQGSKNVPLFAGTLAYDLLTLALDHLTAGSLVEFCWRGD